MNLRTLPKVELHRHLDCSMRFSTMVEIAKSNGVNIPTHVSDQKQFFLVKEPMNDLEAVLKKFMTAQALLNSEEVLERLVYECIEDAFNDNIRVLELRYSLTFISMGHPHLTWDKIIRAFEKGKARAINKFPMAVGFISTLQRILSVEENKKTLDFTLNHKEHFIGVDLADNEISFPAKPFAQLFQSAKAKGFGITIHAGEPNVPTAPNNVKDAIELLGATRIGHGLQIIKSPDIIDLVKKNKIHLELCPTSNYLTKAIDKIEDHPIKKLWDLGVSLSINTDDPGIFDYNMNHEYELSHNKLGLSVLDFQKMNHLAAAASFINPTEIKKYWSFQ